MNRIDVAIAQALQRNSQQSISELADLVGTSPSACHRRIKQLEMRGVVAGYGARLDPAEIGLALLAFVNISLTSQSRDALEAFEVAVARSDDILECHLMSGNADYIVRVAAANLEAFDALHRNCLSRLPGVSAMHTSFVIRRIKDWTGYRLPD